MASAGGEARCVKPLEMLIGASRVSPCHHANRRQRLTGENEYLTGEAKHQDGSARAKRRHKDGEVSADAARRPRSRGGGGGELCSAHRSVTTASINFENLLNKTTAFNSRVWTDGKGKDKQTIDHESSFECDSRQQEFPQRHKQIDPLSPVAAI